MRLKKIKKYIYIAEVEEDLKMLLTFLIDLGYEDVTNLGGIKDAAIFLERNITE